MVSKFQNAFVESRQILDVVLIAIEEAIDSMFFFLIKNEEKYINRRKDTKKREETKGRMRGPSYTN